MLRIVFMGTPDFAVPTLVEIVGVDVHVAVAGFFNEGLHPLQTNFPG